LRAAGERELGTKLFALTGRQLWQRFILRDANLYSYRFMKEDR